MDSSLRLVVTGDSQSAVDALNKVNTSMKAVSSTVPSFGSALSDAKERVETLTAKLYLLNREALSGNIGKGLSAQLKAAKTDLENLEKQAGITGETTSNAFTKAYSSLRQLAYILPGIGIAGIIGAISGAIIELGTSAFGTAEKNKLLNDSLAQGAGAAEKDIAGITALNAIVQDETKSRDLRTKAFKELQDQYPGYFKNLSLEKSSLEEIQDAMNKVSAALIRQAQIKGLEGALAKIFEQQAKAATDSILDTFKEADLFTKIKTIISGGPSATGLLGGLLGAQADKNKSLKDQFDSITKSLQGLIETSLKGGDEGLLGEKAIKNVDQLKKDISELGQVISDLKSLPQTLPVRAEINKFEIEKTADELKLLLRDKIKEGLSEEVFTARLEVLKQKLLQLGTFDLRAKIRFDLLSEGQIQDPAAAIEKQFRKLDKDAFIHLTIAGFDQDEVKQRLLEAQKIAQQFGSSVRSTIEGTIAGIGESIGEAIGSGGLDKALNQLGNVLANALRAIGAAYIKAGTAALIAKTAFEKFLIANPILSIAAGVGLEILAGVLKSQVGKTKAFAEGGIITGPTLGLVGEAGPEVVFPLDRLNQFIKKATTSNNVQVAGEFGINGNDLKLVLARTNKNQGLV